MKDVLHDICIRALAGAASFLRSLESKPVDTQAEAQDHNRSYPKPWVRLTSPIVNLHQESVGHSGSPPRKYTSRRRLTKIQCHEILKNETKADKLPQCTPVRDLRPFLKKQRNMTPKLYLNSHGISKNKTTNQKSLRSNEGNKMTLCLQKPNPWYSRDEIILPPSAIRKQLALERLRERRRREIKKLQENGMVIRGKTLEDRKVDWDKYAQDRDMDQPICVKRRDREELIEVILAEPEIKIRRIDDELDMKLEREGRRDKS